MAESTKSVADQIVGGQRKSTFEATLRSVMSLETDKAEIQGDITEYWKSAKEHGINPAAARLVVRLKKMDTQARNDFLLAFDIYRDWANLDEQAEMFELEDVNPHLKTVEPHSMGPIPEWQAMLDNITEVDGATMAVVSEELAEPVDLAPIEMPPDETAPEAGETPEEAHADGMASCRLEVDAKLNPYDENTETELYDAWQVGWQEAFNTGEWGADASDDEDSADTLTAS
jgi:uncharacterized protein (UPF0335 family)